MAAVAWTGRWTWEESSESGEEYRTSTSSPRKRLARSRAGVLPARYRDPSFELPFHEVLDSGTAHLQRTHKRVKSEPPPIDIPKRRSRSPSKSSVKGKGKAKPRKAVSSSSASPSKPHVLYRIEDDFIYGNPLSCEEYEESDSADDFALVEASSSDIELPPDRSGSLEAERERNQASLTPDMASSWLTAFASDPLMCMFAADGKPRRVATLERISFAERVRRAKARWPWALEQDKSVDWLRARTLDMRNVYIAMRNHLSPVGACTAMCIWPPDSPDRQLLSQLMELHSAPWWPKWHDEVATKYRNLEPFKTEANFQESRHTSNSEAPMSSAYAALLQISGSQAIASTSSHATANAPPQLIENGARLAGEQQASLDARRQRFLQKQAELNRQLQFELQLLRAHYEAQRSAIEEEFDVQERAATPSPTALAEEFERALTPSPGSSDDPTSQNTSWSTMAEQGDSMASADTEVNAYEEYVGLDLPRSPRWREPEQQDENAQSSYAAWIDMDNDAEEDGAASYNDQAVSSVARDPTPASDIVALARQLVAAAAEPSTGASSPLARLDFARELDSQQLLTQDAELAEQMANAAECEEDASSSFETAAVASSQSTLHIQEPNVDLDASTSSQASLPILRFGTGNASASHADYGAAGLSISEEGEGATESELAVLRLIAELGREDVQRTEAGEAEASLGINVI